MKTQNKTRNNLKSGLKSLLAASLIGLSGLARADSLILEERVVSQTDTKPVTQTAAKYGQSRALYQVSQDQEAYGLNLENNYLRLNAGTRDNQDDKKDSSNYTLGLKQGSNFLEGEYNTFGDEKKQDVYATRLGLKFTDNFEVQGSANTLGDWRAATFLQIGKEHKVGIAGGQNLGDSEVMQVYGTGKVTENYNANSGVTFADGKFTGARLRFGRKSSMLNGAGSYGVKPGFVNDSSETLDSVSASSDVTMPYGQGAFSFLSAENQMGDKTGDIGGDIRHLDGIKTYARFALNVGDYRSVKDAAITFGASRDHKTDQDAVEAGFFLNAGPFRIGSRADFKENAKPNYSAFLGISKEFGGKAK